MSEGEFIQLKSESEWQINRVLRRPSLNGQELCNFLNVTYILGHDLRYSYVICFNY